MLFGELRCVDEKLVEAASLVAALEDERMKELVNVPLMRSWANCLLSRWVETPWMLPDISRAACGVDDALHGTAADHPQTAGVLVTLQTSVMSHTARANRTRR